MACVRALKPSGVCLCVCAPPPRVVCLHWCSCASMHVWKHACLCGSTWRHTATLFAALRSMGDGDSRFNAPHRYQLGWLHPSAALLSAPHSAVLTLASSSVVTPTDPDVALIRLIRGGVEFWLSLRTAVDAPGNFDGQLGQELKNLVYLHRWTPPRRCRVRAACARGPGVGGCRV